MKKTLLKIVLFFTWLSLPFSFCVQTSISDYQYGEQITSSDISLQPPAFMERASLGVQTIGNSYTVRDTALNIIKAEYGAMPGFVDLKTLAEQFTSGVNIKSAGNIVTAGPAALPTKAQVVANAAIMVDPINQGRSPTMLQFGVEAAQLGFTDASGKSPVLIADAAKDDGLVKIEVSPQEQVPAIILPPSGLPKAEHKFSLSEAGPGEVGQVGIPQNLKENQNPSGSPEEKQTQQTTSATNADQTKQLPKARGSIIKRITDFIGLRPKTIAVREVSKSINSDVDFQKPKGADEKTTSTGMFGDFIDLILNPKPKTIAVKERSKSTNQNTKQAMPYSIALITMIEGSGEGSGKYNKTDLTWFANLQARGLLAVKELISGLGQASPTELEHIEYFLACVYYTEAEPKIKNQILDIVLDELQHNSNPKNREKIPTILRRIYITLNLYADLGMCSPLNLPGAKKIQDSLIYSLQNDPASNVRFQAGYELLRAIANPETLPIITKVLCTDPAFQGIIDPGKDETHSRITLEYSMAFNVNAIVPELIPYLGNKESSKRAIALLAAIGQPAAEPLLMLVGDKGSDPASVNGAVAALSEIGSTAFALPLIKIINDFMLLNSVKRRIMEKVTGNSDFDVIRTELQWEKLALDTSATPLIRAIALSKIIKNAAFLENYVFKAITSKGLLIGLKQFTVEEFIGVLASGVPAKQGWWGRIYDRATKTEYVQQVFAADMTDQRHYHRAYNIVLSTSYRNWACRQFAAQIVMNSTGWNSDSWADLDGFSEYGAGYTNYAINDRKGGYGLPIHCAKMGCLHAFNAVFMGDDFNNRAQRLDYKNWLFIEPQDDSVMNPKNTEIKIFFTPDTYFVPDGFFIDEDDYIILKLPH